MMSLETVIRQRSPYATASRPFTKCEQKVVDKPSNEGSLVSSSDENLLAPDDCQRHFFALACDHLHESEMDKLPPVYHLTFVGAAFYGDTTCIIIDAATDDEAASEAGAMMVGRSCAAFLWADDRLIRQFRTRPPSVSEVAVIVRARQLRVKLRSPRLRANRRVAG